LRSFSLNLLRTDVIVDYSLECDGLPSLCYGVSDHRGTL